MIKIGELSSLTDVPIKTIRFYEDMGIFSPVEVDRWTGYRYYDDSSITRLSEIAYLKSLGFSLKEIKEMSEDTISKKLEELKFKQTKIDKNIKELSALQIGGIDIMKNFVNDPQVIGKWRLLGMAKNEEEIKASNLKKAKDFAFKELYFLPNGEDYWVISWSKGKLFIKDRPNKYKIVDGRLLVYLVDRYLGSVDDIAVYEKIDSKEYKAEDIRIRDNINLPFIIDKRVVGAWEVVDFVSNKKEFNTKSKEEHPLKSEIFFEDGTRTVIYNNNAGTSKWTKNYLIDEGDKTVSEYEIVEKDGETFMIAEWKSGDYIFGGKVYGYYVFKKVK